MPRRIIEISVPLESDVKSGRGPDKSDTQGME